MGFEKISLLQICDEVFQHENEKHRYRRSAESPLYQPRMFTLRKGSKFIPNLSPTIITNIVICEEDRPISQQINVRDPDLDPLLVSLSSPPRHGTADITSDGILIYTPRTDFSGEDEVKVKVDEVNITFSLTPHQIEKSIKIVVLPRNDEPELTFYKRLHSLQSTKNNITSEVLLEGNETRRVFYGILVLDDVDVNNTVKLGSLFNNTASSFYTLKEQAKNEVSFSHRGVHREFQIRHDIDKTYSGLATFAARAHDEFDDNKVSFSKELRINTYLLINPCIHGVCANQTETSCIDKSRAFSFENYRCECSLGYRGEWCEIDINECSPNPCSVFYDCHNLIGRYECTLNGAKTFGLAVGFIIIIATIFVLIRRCILNKRPQNNKIGPTPIW